jgi:hypothetical protein
MANLTTTQWGKEPKNSYDYLNYCMEAILKRVTQAENEIETTLKREEAESQMNNIMGNMGKGQ